MTRPVLVIPVAERELLEAAAYYDERAPGLGADFLAMARRAVSSLTDSVVFIVRDGTVYAIAFAHSRRLPGYWRTRMRTI